MSKLPLNQSTYLNFLNEGQLYGVQCRSCQAIYLPPRPVCPACHGRELSWIQLGEQGTLLAFTQIFIGPHAMIAAGYDRTRPYCTGIVKLDDGPSISAQILGVDPARAEENPVGVRVTAEFIERGDEPSGSKFLAFRINS